MVACLACLLAFSTYADIDGDGRGDRVSLTRRPSYFTLRVDTRTRLVTKTVRGFSGLKPSQQNEPRIVAMRAINDRPGLEIVVRVWHGASNEFLIVYTLAGDRLHAMTGGPHDPNDPPYVWDLGGSAGTGSSQADCIGRGRIAVLLQWFHRRTWHYSTTTYDAHGTRFVKRVTYQLASGHMVGRLPQDWPHVLRPEFESCPGRAA